MMHQDKKISLSEARSTILSSLPGTRSSEEIPLPDALWRRLAVDVTARRDSPPFDNSAMDGFAVLHPGAAGTGVFRIIGLAKAGEHFPGKVGPGEAVRIMTGAVIPQGADTVVMKESCDETDDAILVGGMPERGANIRRRGEDIQAGRVALPQGALIGPVETAALATMGCGRVPVVRKPVVAIFATGSELCDLHSEPGRDQIYDSNSYAIASLVRVFGGVPRRLGIVRDEPGAVERAIREAESCDAVVTTGGVSVGEYDFVREALVSAGCEKVFWGVAIRPGKPFFFGTLSGKPVFGLPGNAVSAMVTFTVLAGPALLSMSGGKSPLPVPVCATLTADLKKKRGITLLARVSVSRGEKGLLATPSGGQGSHQVFGMAGANALCIVPEDSDGEAAGGQVDVIPFGSLRLNIFD